MPKNVHQRPFLGSDLLKQDQSQLPSFCHYQRH
uniref:Uncharacterized protein n=1 Tax=Rhizophora mucronata TaxID=61149 RepID=A0A2P2IT28_RHIMU